MIEGLKLDFKASELKAILVKKSRHHRERSDYYKTQLDAVKTATDKVNEELKKALEAADLAEAARDTGAYSNSYRGQDPLGEMRKRIAEHNKKSQLFLLFADHLVDSEHYRLSETDLIRLEILSDF